MMKVISAKEMARIEKIAFSEGASERDFMERAGVGLASVIEDCIKSKGEQKVTLFCGKGNNAGDAYFVACLLKNKYDVNVYQLFPINECSELCKENLYRFMNMKGKVNFPDVMNEKMMPSSGVIVDAILGTGFRGVVKGHLADAISLINQSKCCVISIDIPSGLNGNSGRVEGVAVNAMETFFLGLAKSGFFVEDGWNYVGNLRYVDFGLDAKYIQQAKSDFLMLSDKYIESLLPPIKRNRNKYMAGYIVGLAGSKGMEGAAVLSGYGALRSGAGIVRIMHPDNAWLSGAYELVKECYNNESHVLERMGNASAVFIGPGIGQGKEVREIIGSICKYLTVPSVIDADALNIISEHYCSFPKNAIITPHIGEMHRLLKLRDKQPLSLDFIEQCQHFCNEKAVTLVLKGGPSFILHPDKDPVVSIYGNAGMATAGSGDVLTGVISALLGQGLDSYDAAILGTYIHGKAGDMALKAYNPYSMIASDIIDKISTVMRF